jgi:hypothetical protein
LERFFVLRRRDPSDELTLSDDELDGDRDGGLCRLDLFLAGDTRDGDLCRLGLFLAGDTLRRLDLDLPRLSLDGDRRRTRSSGSDVSMSLSESLIGSFWMKLLGCVGGMLTAGLALGKAIGVPSAPHWRGIAWWRVEAW